MPSLTISLNIPATEYLRFYKGTGKTVVTTADDGRQVQFPAEKLRPFVTREGVHGHFELVFDDNQKFVSLRKMKPTR